MQDAARLSKVLVIIPTLAVGGAEIDLLRVLPRLDRSKLAVDVWTFQERGELAEAMGAAGIRVIGPDPRDPGSDAVATADTTAPALRRARALLQLLDKAAAGARLLKGGGYEVVHAVLPSSYLLAVLACTLASRGRVAMSRLSQNWYQSDHPIFGLLERHLLHRLVSAAIGNAARIVSELRAEGIKEHKLSLVRNGLDVGQFDAAMTDRLAARAQLALPQAAFVVSAVANLHAYKGYGDLLAALALARPRLPDEWCLLVAGSDRDGNRAQLEAQTLQLGLAGHVRFLGPRSDVPVILGAADLHVTASHSEGLPNNVIEAMFARLPVIGTAVGGIPELVEDGRTGLLVPARSPEALARAIIDLADAPERRKAMGQAGRAAAESRYALDRTVTELSQVYEDLAQSYRHGRAYRSRQSAGHPGSRHGG